MRCKNAAWILMLLELLLSTVLVHAQEEGLYADFTTSMGSFTCKLDYVNAPMTVANFVGLAEGSRPWLDLVTGQVHAQPFYDGLIFHRVITNFMSQSGSRNGQGTDNPGYTFPDEFSSLLRHDGPGVLSMANSGKNSNGAQFFITATNTPWLDNVHSVFGRVVSGLNILEAINNVPTCSNRPLADVVILHVAIRRVGESAAAFNITNPALARMAPLSMGTSNTSNGPALIFSREQYCGYQFYSSSNLLSWTGENLGYEIAPPTTTGLVLGARTAGKNTQFFTVTRIQYPTNAFMPWTLQNRSMQLAFNSGLGSLQLSFTNTTTGTYVYNGSPGQIVSGSWQQTTPYRSYLWPIYFSALNPMTLTFNYGCNTGGTFSGQCYTNAYGSFPVSGSFTLGSP
jgi:cyclophilin family peptidyl-prolyl cis-trans isomerase